MKPLSQISFFLVLFIVYFANANANENKYRQYISKLAKIKAEAETEKYYWAGTSQGLYFVRKKNKRVFHLTTQNSILRSDSISCIAVTEAGEVYIGTNNGIVRYDNYTFLLITDENSALQSNRITSLACINGAEILAGTSGGGITAFYNGKSKTFKKKNTQLTSDSVLSFQENIDRSLWAILADNATISIKNKQIRLRYPVK